MNCYSPLYTSLPKFIILCLSVFRRNGRIRGHSCIQSAGESKDAGHGGGRSGGEAECGGGNCRGVWGSCLGADVCRESGVSLLPKPRHCPAAWPQPQQPAGRPRPQQPAAQPRPQQPPARPRPAPVWCPDLHLCSRFELWALLQSLH